MLNKRSTIIKPQQQEELYENITSEETRVTITPKIIKELLDQSIIGQEGAKIELSIELQNHMIKIATGLDIEKHKYLDFIWLNIENEEFMNLYMDTAQKLIFGNRLDIEYQDDFCELFEANKNISDQDYRNFKKRECHKHKVTRNDYSFPIPRQLF